MKQALINGLVLVGGKSSRMGTDKSDLVYHQQRQSEHVSSIMHPFCKTVYLSVGQSHMRQSSVLYPIIKDVRDNNGPMTGLYSAILFDAKLAWLILPCDLPFLDQAVLRKLINEINSDHDVICYFNKARNQAEPLVSIWNPSSFEKVKERYKAKQYSMYGLIQELKSKYIEMEDDSKLMNVNTLEEYKEAKEKIRKGL